MMKSCSTNVEVRYAYEITIGNIQREIQFWRHRRRSDDDDIKMNITDIARVRMDWINLDYDRFHLRIIFHMVNNFDLHKRQRIS
jgi:hypothetical protein